MGLLKRLKRRVARIREMAQEIPDITASRADIVVDTVVQRSRFLLFGSRTWVVTWRSLHKPLQRGVSVLTREVEAGSAALGAERFSFEVSWRADLRRPILRSYENDMVTPLSVMQLGRLSSTE